MKNINLRMEQFTKASGKGMFVTASVYKFGLMELVMRDIGRIIKLMALESSGT